MSQSSYEIVRRAIEFETPERLPVRFAALGVNDIHRVRWNYLAPEDHRLGRSVDEWGCQWTLTEQGNIGQVKGHPLGDWKDLQRYHWPDPDDRAFYLSMERQFDGAQGKYIEANIFMLLFERMQALRGFENVLTDLYLEQERVEDLANRIVEFDLGVIRNISQRFPGQIHGFRFTDDWGTQQNLIVKPELWRDFFKPRYIRIVDAIHAAGWHVWMHCCGKINAILEDLVEIGVDALNLQQPRLLGIEAVGREFKGRVCFDSLCDIQHTLPSQGVDAIREEAQLLLQHWSTSRGGFVLSDYGDGDAIGIDPEKKRAMFSAFLEADPWRRE